MARGGTYISRAREVCYRYSEQISDGGLQTYVDTHDYQLENDTVYRQLISSLMYLINTRPDICFVVNTLSQHMVEPRSVHMIGAKHVLRYIVGAIDFGLDYIRGDGVSLVGYTDSD
jgi:hypothetical protein